YPVGTHATSAPNTTPTPYSSRRGGRSASEASACPAGAAQPSSQTAHTALSEPHPHTPLAHTTRGGYAVPMNKITNGLRWYGNLLTRVAIAMVVLYIPILVVGFAAQDIALGLGLSSWPPR